MKNSKLLLTASLFLSLSSVDANAQCAMAKLLASDGGQTHHYGHEVELMGDTAFVGSTSADGAEFGTGAVYVLERGSSGWVETDKLFDPNGIWQDRFGGALAVEGDTLVVGAYNQGGIPESFHGAVYVYEKGPSGWAQVQKIEPSDSGPNKHFGFDVALDGERMIVGAPGYQYTNDGAAYVYERLGGVWFETAKLTNPTGLPGSSMQYGYRVALKGTTAVVGAPTDGPSAFGGGAAFVYELSGSTWGLQQKIVQQDAESGDALGASFGLLQNVLWIGAPGDVENGIQSGSVILFERNQGVWVERDKVVPSGANDLMGFGLTVHARGGRLVVGAWWADIASTDNGAAYVYDFDPGSNTWPLTALLQPTQPVVGEAFGNALAVSGTRVLVGAQREPSFGLQSGAAYVFELGSTTSTYCSSAPNSAGAGAIIDSIGSTSIAAGDFTLTVNDCPTGVLGTFYYGPQTQEIPFGNGFGCITGGVNRLLPAQGTGASGSVQRLVDFSSAPAGSGPSAIHPGSTWHFQFWYRDPNAGGAGYNLSNALSATFCQ